MSTDNFQIVQWTDVHVLLEILDKNMLTDPVKIHQLHFLI